MSDNKSEGQKLDEVLTYKASNAWEKSCEEENIKVFEFCEGYKEFLNKAKTEREFIDELERLLKPSGFVSIEDIIKGSGKIAPGMKIYHINRRKSAVLAVIGSKPLIDGINVVGAHVDVSRLDPKQTPLYEDTGMALLKTHYYGGIKKYQWVAIPLALHGVIVKNNGETVQVSIGEDDTDEVFTITDLLPHLSADQLQKKMGEAITGEGLNILIGSMPIVDEKVKDKVKLNTLKLLNQRYGITEEDFISAELEFVPAFKARDIGFDRSMIGAYGHDDRVCAYTAFKAMLELHNIETTAVCLLTDKEEIGSVGNTGAQASFFQNFIASLIALGADNYNDLMLRNCLSKSKMLSADVSAAVDPNYEGVQDKKNASYLGKGVIIQKYGGARGKVGASDANAEFVGEIRRLFNKNGIVWQTGELGKVDMGGGGTIAEYLAHLGMEALDCGIALLSMHSPFEIAGKIDIYMAYKAYKAFMDN